MELMSTLLFCVFVTHVPLVLGKENDYIVDPNVKYNYSKKINRDASKRTRVLLNLNGPPLVHGNTEVQAVYGDLTCQNCLLCMDRAVKAQHSKNRVYTYRPSTEELHNEVLIDLHKDENRRDKRNVKTENMIKKKIKVKKNKFHKVVTVTKHHVGGEVYALTVKELYPQPGDQNLSSITCQVYGVDNSLPCSSPESGIILENAKRHLDNKNQRKKDVTTLAPQVKTTVIKKRNVDNSHVSESFMPSIEELY